MSGAHGSTAHIVPKQGNLLLQDVLQDDIERVAIDQLQQLDRQSHALIEIRTAITEANQQDSLEFQEQMSTAVSKVQSTLHSALSAISEQSRDKPAISLQEDEPMEERLNEEPLVQQEPSAQQPSPAPEGIPMPYQEREAVEENAEFLEEIEAVEEEEEAVPQEDLRERVRQQNASMRRQIEDEIRQLRQSCTTSSIL
ncbi:hypothetical protein GCK32_009760 [Trichostrongylus colubriformis]|uniref:Uncharacterized protein n=1 Tax=Trichostrongylus colubriformis TaxID=6319 RepID=A0AAN8F0Y1_TRICO